MSSEPQAVVEFGPEPVESEGRSRRWNVTGIATGLAADRRAVPLAAAVGAVALFASLVSEWQVTVLDLSRFENLDGPLAVGVADLGALGAGFVVGTLALAVATVLVMFGPVAGRGYARLIGLTTGGVLLGLLVALGSMLGDTTRAIDGIFLVEVEQDRIELSYGRGLWCAVFGVLAALLSLYLSGRHIPAAVATDSGEPAGEPDPVWSWRRPRPEAEEQPPDAPLDLSVSSTTPFTSLTDDRDKAGGRDEGDRGISG